MADSNYRRIFAIGDIHGDFTGLRNVLDQIHAAGFDPSKDLVVQLGDFIDGYEDSYTVFKTLEIWSTSYPHNVKVLMGNHEWLMQRAVGRSFWHPDTQTWWQQGGAETFKSLVYDCPSNVTTTEFLQSNALHQFVQNGLYRTVNPHVKELLDFISTRPYTFQTDEYIFVHAGLRPSRVLVQTPNFDKIWIREDFHNSNYDWGRVVVYGHTARENILVETNKIGIDTRWRGRGCVTAVELGEKGKVLRVFEGPRG